jgi:hypothetical protein
MESRRVAFPLITAASTPRHGEVPLQTRLAMARSSEDENGIEVLKPSDQNAGIAVAAFAANADHFSGPAWGPGSAERP